MVNLVLIKAITTHNGKTNVQWINFSDYKIKIPSRPIPSDDIQKITGQQKEYKPPKHRRIVDIPKVKTPSILPLVSTSASATKPKTGGNNNTPKGVNLSQTTPLPNEPITKETLEQQKKQLEESQKHAAALSSAQTALTRHQKRYELSRRQLYPLKKQYFVIPEDQSTQIASFMSNMLDRMFDNRMYKIDKTQLYKIRSYDVEHKTMLTAAEVKNPNLITAYASEDKQEQEQLKKLAISVKRILSSSVLERLGTTDKIYVYTIHIHLDSKKSTFKEKLLGRCSYHSKKFWEGVKDIKNKSRRKKTRTRKKKKQTQKAGRKKRIRQKTKKLRKIK